MKISKSLLVSCAVACCAGSISLAAPDSLSQAQAREALRKKIAELNPQQPVAETPAPVTKPAKAPKSVAVPAPKPRPVVQEPPATVTPAPAAVETTSPPTTTMSRATGEQLARQREALRQKIAELNAQEQVGQATPAPVTVAPVVKLPDTKSVDAKKTEKQAAAEARPSAFAPVQAPSPAVPASKEATLNELLSQYKADTITAEEYHKTRAKILAEP